MPASRDLRIDFFRGVALLVVLVDHVEGWAGASVVENWTLISLGFSDAAEIFVFLSGYVFASAYGRALDRDGLAGCFRKALKRSLQIYVAYVLAAVAVITIGALCLAWDPPLMDDELRVGERLGGSIVAALTLRFHPWGFDILAFYVPVLPVMALLLFVQRRNAPVAWVISAGVYLLVQLAPELNLHRFADGKPWYFNPLAWQFLFFIGIYLGDPLRPRRRWIPRSVALPVALGVLAWGIYTLKVCPYLVSKYPRLYADALPLFEFYWSWAGKTSLQPLRLVHFFSLVYITAVLLPGDLKFWSTKLARPLVVAGQNSLEVYAWGLVLSFLGAFAILLGADSIAAVTAIDLVACGASIAIGYLIRGWKRRRLAAPRSAEISVAPHAITQRKAGRERTDRGRPPRSSARS